MATEEEIFDYIAVDNVIALMAYAILHGYPDAITFSEDGKTVIIKEEELEIINKMLEKEN